MQFDYDKEKALWKRLVIEPEYKALEIHIADRIEHCHSVLEKEDSADARAEIRVLRNILLQAETHRDDK